VPMVFGQPGKALLRVEKQGFGPGVIDTV